jgi:hypothetical protein
MKIEASGLTTCCVVKGGDHISLGLLDRNGETVEIEVSAADACSIAMSLPRLLNGSLREKYADPSLRYVFPLDMWKVEAASDGTQVIMTFQTGGGYEVSFSTRPDMCQSLGGALAESTETGLPTRLPLKN